MATQSNLPISSTQVSTTSESVSNQTVTAQFSNWNNVLTDVRKRYWDEKSGTWYWKIEDVQDADTPNINQLDISIQPNERVEIRVSAISEVGWPDSILESDWSNVLTVDFPDDINDVINENDFILQEATQDQTLVQMDSTLNTKGIYQHIDDQFYLNNILFKHTDKNIGTSFKGDQSNTLNLFEYLTSLTDRIKSLEETISKVKGQLKIYLYKNDVLIKEVLNNTNTNVKVELEDYLTAATGSTRTYVNNLYMIDDYTISLSNVAQTGNLGLLSNRLYTSGGTNVFYNDSLNQALLVDYNDDLYTQQNNQFIWFFDKDNQQNIYTGITATSMSTGSLLNTTNYNIGATGTTALYQYWTDINSIFPIAGQTGMKLLATVHPYLPDITNLVESGQEKTKTVNPQTNFIVGMKIFFKWDGGSNTASNVSVSSIGGHINKTRKIKYFFETNDGLTYQFTITFTLSNFRQYFVSTTNQNVIASGGVSVT
jgi:hypothetical protein